MPSSWTYFDVTYSDYRGSQTQTLISLQTPFNFTNLLERTNYEFQIKFHGIGFVQISAPYSFVYPLSTLL
jgi:hypothetical protein